VIIVRDPNDIESISLYKTLTDTCLKNPEYEYTKLKNKKFPFVYKGRRFDKIEVNRKRR
jgi:hypothetical protein